MLGKHETVLAFLIIFSTFGGDPQKPPHFWHARATELFEERKERRYVGNEPDNVIFPHEGWQSGN